MPQLGIRLPEHIFDKVMDRRRCVRHTRKCPECGFKWPTAEVSLVKSWDGIKFDCCQVHTRKPGVAYMNIGITRAKSGDYFSNALVKVLSWGGYYRRRECQAVVRFVGEKSEVCKARWTTAEVSVDGVIGEDVQKCARCGSIKSRIQRKIKKQKLWA